jgi:hypothetical protein
MTSTYPNRQPARVRKPNALKHGAYSTTEVLPWEDREEFEELQRDLVDQYRPAGPLQEDCIRGIASYLWRKRRIQKKRQIEAAAALQRMQYVSWEHPNPLYDDLLDEMRNRPEQTDARPQKRTSFLDPSPAEDYAQLLSFSNSLYRFHQAFMVRFTIAMLPKEFADHLNEKCPEANYEETEHWVVAVKREADGVLLPMVRKRHPEVQSDQRLELAAEFLTEERLLADLAADERFDSAIDRLMKRFFVLRAAEELAEKRVRVVTPQLLPPDRDPSSA